MTTVKSPYNFVPAPVEDQVFKPEWAKDVSHDIPFEDGESGEIEIEITAETPIFIRDGYSKPKEGAKPTEQFSHFLDKDGKPQYFIPATSLKGMVRNVLEIMSFSRLNKDFVHNSRFSQRDISTADTQYMKKYQKDQIKAGWLFQDKEGNWSIKECESFSFIDHRELEQKLRIPFRDYFLVTDRFGKPKKILKSAKEKYEELRKINVGLNHSFTKGEKKLFGNVVLPIATVGGSRKGTLVLTGQPAKRIEEAGKKASGKVREFVFFDSENPEFFKVSSDVQKDFRFIYNDNDPNNISKDWKYFRDEFLNKDNKDNRVPVFFSPGNNQTVKHFGLAYMYKLPYDYNVHSLNPIKNYNSAPDLANTIFGKATKDDSLKGRVFFGHTLADSKTVVIDQNPIREILSSPKASYFPFYLDQFKNDKGEYYTYDDAHAVLRGYKRYPVREDKTTGVYDSKQIQNQKTWTEFKPLQKGVKFLGKIRFHNLRKEEIGALLSALTFHNNSDLCYHSLGGAKPFGYGRISLKSQLKPLEKGWTFEECLVSFEELMESHMPNWINSKQIMELFSMAILGNEEQFLIYPTTTEYQDYKKREIKKAPKKTEKLDNNSDIKQTKVKIKGLLSVKPKIQKLTDYPKSGGKVDVKVIGQEGLQMKVEAFLEGMEGKIFQIRFPEGLKYFGKDSILEADITFPQPNNRKQFNLSNPKRK